MLQLAEESGDDVFTRAGKQMLNKQSGYEQYRNKISDQESCLFCNQIQYAQWSLGVVFIKNELLGNAVALSKKMMHIGFSVGFLILVLAGFWFKIYELQ